MRSLQIRLDQLLVSFLYMLEPCIMAMMEVMVMSLPHMVVRMMVLTSGQ